jgi:hypothetical protein
LPRQTARPKEKSSRPIYRPLRAGKVEFVTNLKTVKIDRVELAFRSWAGFKSSKAADLIGRLPTSFRCRRSASLTTAKIPSGLGFAL